MYSPSWEWFGAESDLVAHEKTPCSEDATALLEHIAHMRMLALCLNAHLIAPTMPEV